MKIIRRIHEWGKYHCQWWLFTRHDLGVAVRSARRNGALVAQRDLFEGFEKDAAHRVRSLNAQLKHNLEQQEND